MGNACTNNKAKDVFTSVSLPVYKSQLSSLRPPIDLFEARIGPYFQFEELNKHAKFFDRLKKWNRIISRYNKQKDPFSEYMKECPTTFTKRIKKGPPAQYRWKAWLAFLNIPSKINVTLYESLPLPNSIIVHTIEKDLERTYPTVEFFQAEKYNGMDQLFTVLTKLATYLPQIGYCQGMNFVAGFLLMVSGGNEIEAFFAMVELIQRYGLAELY